jgi:alpha-beta hydrolase superfamily lysophospholipase
VNSKLHGALLRILFAALLLAAVVACAVPRIQQTVAVEQPPLLNPDAAFMSDGYRLPLSVWRPADRPRTVILALHGFNDYRNAFRDPARYFSAHGIVTVAYDQRGFGETGQRGIWPGEHRLAQDAREVADLLCKQYPGLPLFVLGESMGGAVLIEALQGTQPDCVAGSILVAPAVWGWQTMPWWQALSLRVIAHLVPAMKLTGEGLDIMPSDNIEMLRALSRDPLVIKATRVDALYGVTNLMSAALDSSTTLAAPALLLYGEHDEIIPPAALCQMKVPGRNEGNPAWHMALYPDGYHMLLRDLQAEVVLQDIISWVADRHTALPSGFDGVAAASGMQRLCAGS